jgi:HAD superfamily hydrolase (TIGR01509 family)
VPAAVIFDLDGILVDSEPVWAEVKREVALAHGGHWTDHAATDMLGMNGPEWSRYLRDELGVQLDGLDIQRLVVDGVRERVAVAPPAIPGAHDAVVAIADRWPVGLASSADRPVIMAILEAMEIADRFGVVVSAEEAGRGKPAPDVYLEAARQLAVDPRDSVGIEDSGNGMRAVKAAGMALIAIPNPGTPVLPDALALADVVLDTIADLTPDAVDRAARVRNPT